MGKNKKKKRTSITNRLTGWIVVVMLFFMTITTGVISLLVYAFTEVMVFDLYSSIIEATDAKVANMLTAVEVAAKNNVSEVERSLDNPDRVSATLAGELRLNPHLMSCTAAFEPNVFPKKGRWFEPQAEWRDSAQVEVKQLGSEQHDYLNASWYKKAKAANGPYWSNPYHDDAGTGDILCSFSLPIHDKQGRPVGIYEANVSLEWLRERVEEINRKYAEERFIATGTGKGMYLFILEREGEYIVHPDKKRHSLDDNFFNTLENMKDTVADRVLADMRQGRSGDAELMVDGRESIVFYAPMDRAGWTMVIAEPKLHVNIIGYTFAVIVALFMVMGMLVTIVVCRITIRRITKPLWRFALTADEVAKGNFATRLPTVKRNDELGRLRDAFENMQQSLTRYVEELQTTTAQKASIESELKIASDIQMSMLPKTFQMGSHRHDVHISAMLVPAKAVGGDLYDFYIRDEKLFFCIGDVSGKGVPASLVMAVTRALFRNISAHESQPHRILSALNDTIAENNEAEMFVTLFVGVFDLQTGILHYSNAGHDKPLLIGRGVGMLPCDTNLPAGAVEGWEFTLQEVDIDHDTTMFLYTDGLTEAEDANHALFGEQRPLEVAEAALADGQHQPEAIIRRMTEAVHDFVGEAEQSDDLTMLAIQFT